MILKIVPHLWTSEASLGKRSGAFAFKTFRALAAALQDDRHAVELANFHPFATFPPFFALLSLTTIGSGFQDTRMYNFGSYLLQVRCDMLW